MDSNTNASVKSLSIKDNLISNKSAKLLPGTSSYIGAVSKGTSEGKNISKI